MPNSKLPFYYKKNNYICGVGTVRIADAYYDIFLRDYLKSKSVLDIGCGDASILNIVDKSTQYQGIDINAGCYGTVENSNVQYLDTNKKITDYIKANTFDTCLLINVLEHTESFSELFELALMSSTNSVFVSLPNEENIHNRLNFLFGNGLLSHGLEMFGKHLNHRHLWLIQLSQAKNVLEIIANEHGYKLTKKFYYIAYPSTLWKRLIYKFFINILPNTLKARNFAFIFEKNKLYD